MINIKVCDVAPKGACSYYRGIGPLSKLRKINPDIHVEYIDSVSWTTLTDCDILYMVRPVENNYIETLNIAQNFGIPVWIDFDDLLQEIPTDNPSYSYFSQDYILKNMETALKKADIVTVSTPAIKDFYSHVNPNIIVIENAFNDYNYKLVNKDNNSKLISWRGSNTHRNDLLSIKESLNTISHKFTDWSFIFIGGDAWYISNYLNNSTMIDEIEIMNYNNFISQLQPAIHIVPLVDSVFNRSKSNISWIEGTVAGAVCIAPDLPEFNKSGILNYIDNFEYLLNKAINSKSFRKENYEKSFEYIKDNLMLSKINQKRIQIIEGIL